ncbi:DUF861 domain-containing protein [Gordonia sp. SID5947]|uniref:cupin domain-containing protein n=1 Tax=Gordonia sp. SID5947 TaxID=2690315 RepID=UPI001368D148|nr:cupin domain-containing protein [Gordonia sp. SID5947]MYR07971.1 DUF861 domain-containing protein [Gordonia sp. SID5947]
MTLVYTARTDATEYTRTEHGVSYHTFRDADGASMTHASIAECGAFNAPYHCDEDEFILGLAGELTVQFPDRDPMRVAEGDIVVLTAGTDCTLIVDSTFRWVYLKTVGKDATK